MVRMIAIVFVFTLIIGAGVALQALYGNPYQNGLPEVLLEPESESEQTQEVVEPTSNADESETAATPEEETVDAPIVEPTLTPTPTPLPLPTTLTFSGEFGVEDGVQIEYTSIAETTLTWNATMRTTVVVPEDALNLVLDFTVEGGVFGNTVYCMYGDAVQTSNMQCAIELGSETEMVVTFYPAIPATYGESVIGTLLVTIEKAQSQQNNNPFDVSPRGNG